MGRIAVRDQPGQIVCKTPSQPIAGCSGVHMSYQAMWEAQIGRIMVLGRPVPKVCEIHISTKKCSVWWHTSVISGMAGSLKMRIVALVKNVRPYL
jgi:hypothetical protein